MSHSKVEVSRKRRVFSEEFKQDAVRLVVSENYTFAAAARTPRSMNCELKTSGCGASCGGPRWSAKS